MRQLGELSLISQRCHGTGLNDLQGRDQARPVVRVQEELDGFLAGALWDVDHGRAHVFVVGLMVNQQQYGTSVAIVITYNYLNIIWVPPRPFPGLDHHLVAFPSKHFLVDETFPLEPLHAHPLLVGSLHELLDELVPNAVDSPVLRGERLLPPHLGLGHWSLNLVTTLALEYGNHRFVGSCATVVGVTVRMLRFLFGVHVFLFFSIF